MAGMAYRKRVAGAILIFLLQCGFLCSCTASGKAENIHAGDESIVMRDEMQRYNLAHDMLEMMELFENDAKSEFYYYKDMDKWKYEIL